MAIQNQPGFIPTPFANSGTKNVIPETMPTPSASAAASWTDGFPTVCSLPLASGGIPPARADFNGLLNWMTQAQAFYQSGGVYEWDATIDYDAQRIIRGSNGLLYRSMAQSGPNTGAGAVDPTADDGTYWGAPLIPTMPAGDNSQAAATTSFVGSAINIAVPVGIVLWSAGSATPAGYLLCNGAAISRTTYADLFAVIGTTYGAGDDSTTFNLPDLIDKFPQGDATPGTVKNAGLPDITGVVATGGNSSVFWTDDISGAFTPSSYATSTLETKSASNNPTSKARCSKATFNASYSNNIYGNSSTVQPPALTLLPCIKY